MNKIAGWFRKWTHSIPTAPAHVTNEQILLLLDGEVVDSERRRIERHLTDCWNCRFRCEEMQSAIHHMVECRNLVVDHRLESEPPSSRALLAARLEEQRKILAAPAHPAIMWLARYRHAALALAAGCVILVATSALWHQQADPLVASDQSSAQDTLHRAISAEGAESVPAGRVRHRSLVLRIRNVTRAAEMTPQRVDVWDDPARHQSATVDAAPPASEGEHAAVGNRLASLGARKANPGLLGSPSPIVPAGFESLRVSEFSKLIAEPSQLSVTRDKTTATLLYQPHQSLTTPSRQPRVLLARLDLRSVDLHPVAEELAVADDSSTWEFRLSEEADVTVPLADMPAGLFNRPVNAPPAASSAGPPAAPGSVDEVVDVLTVLDGAGALTQQDVQLQRTPDGSLQVKGVVQDDVRRQALLQLLQPDAGHGVAVRIATVAEQNKQSRKTTSVLVAESAAEGNGADAALTAYLTNTLHYSAAGAALKRVELENQLLAWSSDAESQAEALHEVLSLVPQARTVTASDQALREWQSLVQHHVLALEQDLANIEKTLRPLSGNPDLSTCAAQPPTPLADPAALLATTRRISNGVSNFVASPAAGTQTNILSASFGCLLQTAEQRASRLITPPPEP